MFILFIPSRNSPGAVLRFVERNCFRLRASKNAIGATKPFNCYISDALLTGGVRALFVTSSNDRCSDFIEGLAPLVAQSFDGDGGSGATTLIYANSKSERWHYEIWESGKIKEQGEGFALAPNRLMFLHGLWRRATKKPIASQTAFAWAMARGLPVDRTPLAPARQFRKISVIDYAVVAQLDQRSLLVEDGPRLYRFVIGGGS